jgi:hypothetical protein
MGRGAVIKSACVAVACLAIQAYSTGAYAQLPLTTEEAGSNAATGSANRVPCSEKTKVIHDFVPQFALNDFAGITQDVEALSYSRSQCLENGRDRWFIEVSAAHVHEKLFSANQLLAGIGISLHPIRKRPNLLLTPVARIGREDPSIGPAATVLDGALTVSDAITLTDRIRSLPARDVNVATLLFEWAARAEYTTRIVGGSGPLAGRDTSAATFYGSVGLDGAAGSSPWRWKSTLAYQTLPGPTDGFAALSLSARRMNADYSNYKFNLGVSGRLGDRGYRGVILFMNVRFHD